MSQKKVWFELVPDEDDYPPFRVETVWATVTAIPDQLVIDNIPFYATEATVGDTVRVREVDGRLKFVEIVHRSRSSLVRVVAYDKARIPELRDDIRKLGCTSEWNGGALLAVDVPGDVRLSRVQRWLRTKKELGVLGYEEPILRQPELYLELSDESGSRVLIVEDDGRTGYAYLREEQAITSDVWLYNRSGVEEPSWEDAGDLPFPNKLSFMRSESLVLVPDSLIRADWDEDGVDVYVDGVRTARLARGACPGWSRLAAIDGPLARVLTETGERRTPAP